jgi:uncharacterized protein (TIGR03000 family)
MLKKLTTLGLFAAVALALLATAQPSHAQRWRGAGPRLEGRGLDIGGGYYGSSYYSDGGWYGYNRGWSSPYYGSSYYYGSSPYYYSYSTPYYYDTYSSAYYPSNRYTSMYFSGDMDTARAENRVMLNIQAPPGAGLWISDVFMGEGDGNRQFISPPLENGRKYVYDVKARWMQDGREMTSSRTLEFQAGQTNLSFDLFQGAQPVSTPAQPQGTVIDRTREYRSAYPQNAPTQQTQPSQQPPREQLPNVPRSEEIQPK